jgi:histidinol-phosphate aminotransferase
MKKLVPDYIQNAKLYPPGIPLEEVKRKLGIDDIVKLNSNENSLGPSLEAVKAIYEAAAKVNLYPDNSAFYLKQKLSVKHDVLPEQIILGNGSNELVQFILMTFLLPGEEVITCSPTFLLYGIMGRVMGGNVKEAALKDFCFDLEAVLSEVTGNTKLVFISNPNNPTGTIVSSDNFKNFMDRMPDDVIVVMDEAYFEYVTDKDCPDSIGYVRDNKNVIVLRTFSKAYGLAGLRVGYAFAPERLVDQMEKVREPFNTNSLAQKAAIAALDDVEHIRKTTANNRTGLSYVYEQLRNLDLDFIPTQANFVAVKLGVDAGRICDRLMKSGVLVRNMESFNMAQYIRVSIGLPVENERFIKELKKILAS